MCNVTHSHTCEDDVEVTCISRPVQPNESRYTYQRVMAHIYIWVRMISRTYVKVTSPPAIAVTCVDVRDMTHSHVGTFHSYV